MQAVAPRGVRELLSGGYDSETLQTLSGAFTPAQLLANLQSIQDALTAMAAQPNPRIAAELCLIRLCRPELCDDVPTLCARVDKLEQAVHSGDIPAPTAAAQQNRPLPRSWARAESGPAQAAQPKPEAKTGIDAPRGSRRTACLRAEGKGGTRNRNSTMFPVGAAPEPTAPPEERPPWEMPPAPRPEPSHAQAGTHQSHPRLPFGTGTGNVIPEPHRAGPPRHQRRVRL